MANKSGFKIHSGRLGGDAGDDFCVVETASTGRSWLVHSFFISLTRRETLLINQPTGCGRRPWLAVNSCKTLANILQVFSLTPCIH